ncbi:MAG: [protein-PII] uridylyltransferase, partial [Deltaproteobacteria bacterium]|nr:[protein-PII] uridylyltransferase [Deltaproteobacteria bacterium]
MDIINKTEADLPQLFELRTRRDLLEILWRRGLSGRALLREHTELIDSHLVTKFKTCPAASGMALIAVGGYGRRELFPFSDIDLLILHDSVSEDQLNIAAEAILYPLWDAGLDVGHSVRTIDQCLTDADNDFFFQVALLDARLIVGETSIFEKLQKSWQQQFVLGRRQNFFDQMVAHRDHRLKTFAKHGYLLEPQIKEGRGGLRDLQAMLWTSKVIFGLKDLNAIEDAGILSNTERHNLTQAWEHLIQIRNRLHYLSGRKNDRLYFERQEEISRDFNYRKTTGIKAVEQFMREVYDHLQTIAVSADLFFAHVDESLKPIRPGSPDNSFRALEPGIVIRHKHIHLDGRQDLGKTPELAMRIFLQAAKTGRRIHHQTRKMISANLEATANIQSSAAAGRDFINILYLDKNSPASLETMLECGFLAAYLPEFAHLKSLAQHDVYHIFTVDYHLVQTVAAVAGMKEKYGNIFEIISKPRILFLAALLHDIGKGYGGDHADRGASLAEQTGRRLGLHKSECRLLGFIIKKHLFLGKIALRRDLEDTSLIRRCAAIIQSPERLAMLYLLSIADAMATGPTVWNDWYAALLLELYLKIALLLEKNDQGDQDINQGISWIRNHVAELLGSKSAFDLQDLPNDYLLNFSPEEIANHIRLSQDLGADDCVIESRHQSGHLSLLIVAKDRPGLLTKICGTTALNGLEILAAQIFTWPDGTAVDSIDVWPIYDEDYNDERLADLRDDLRRAFSFRLGLDYRLHNSNIQPVAKAKIEAAPPKVVIDNESSDTFTIIEVYADKHIGIIYKIAKALCEFQINIFRA